MSAAIRPRTKGLGLSGQMAAIVAATACFVTTDASVRAADGSAVPSGSDQPEARTLNARPRLVAERESLVAGQTADIAITWSIKDKWHLYWTGQNDTGMAPSGKLTALIDGKPTDGVVFGAWKWPAPQRYVLPGDILDYVYFNRLTVLVPVTVSESLAGKAVLIKADLEWLVCDEACVLEKEAVELSIPVVASAEAQGVKHSADRTIFRDAQAGAPRPLAQAMQRPASEQPVISGNRESVTIKWPEAMTIAFLPHGDGVRVSNALSGGAVTGDTIRLELDRGSEPGKERLRGLLQVAFKLHTVPSTYEVDLSEAQWTSGARGDGAGANPGPERTSDAQPGKPG